MNPNDDDFDWWEEDPRDPQLPSFRGKHNMTIPLDLNDRPTDPFYIVLAADQDRVSNPGGGFRRYETEEAATRAAKKYIRGSSHETFFVLYCQPVAIVGEVPKDIPVQRLHQTFEANAEADAGEED